MFRYDLVTLNAIGLHETERKCTLFYCLREFYVPETISHLEFFIIQRPISANQIFFYNNIISVLQMDSNCNG